MQPRGTATKLSTALASEDVRLRARSVECRATMCRVELKDEGSSTQHSLERMAMRLGPELPEMLADWGDDGAENQPLVIYLSPQPFVSRREVEPAR